MLPKLLLNYMPSKYVLNNRKINCVLDQEIKTNLDAASEHKNKSLKYIGNLGAGEDSSGSLYHKVFRHLAV